MKLLKIAILILLILKVDLSFSQNTTCGNATPFCTGQTMTYPASTNAGSAGSGPNYGCLGSEPNPAWFFMQMANSGSMSIVMSAANDIDFICWGPFPNLSGACNSLTASYIQSCSYSASNTETCSISSAVAGQFYIMLITNYSNTSQIITFDQTNIGNTGAASTNCGFVCVVTATASAPICSGQNATIGISAGTSTSVISYTWTGPNSYNSTLGSNVLTNLQTSGLYTVTATSGAIINNTTYTQTCQAVVNVSVVPTPSFNVSPSTTAICQGGSFNAGVTFTPYANPSNFNYLWSPNYATGGVWNTTASLTLISPPLAQPGVTLTTLIYSVTVTPATTLASCPVKKTMTVTLNNPSTPTISPPNPVCNTSGPIQLTAAPGGGTWTGTPAVSVSGSFSPSLGSIPSTSVMYQVSVGNCIVSNTAAVPVSKFYSSALTSTLSTLCVQDQPFNLMNIVQNTLTGSWTGTHVNNLNLFDPSGLSTGTYNLTYSTTSWPNPTVCPSSTVLSVPVFNPPAPVISAIQPTCTNGGTVILSANPPGGIWSGATGVSPSGVQTPSLNSIGTNTVTYVAGLGTCVATSSKTFHVSQFNSAALTGSISPLCVNNNPVNLLGVVQNTTGTWTGLGMISGGLFSPASLVTNIYSVVYNINSFPNPFLCPDSRTLAISVLNPPKPNIKQVGPVCSADSPIQMTVTPSTGHWVASTFLSASGVFSPGISPVGLNSVQYVIGTNTCFAQQTLPITTEAFISAGLTASVPNLCSTSPPLNLLPITANNLGSWTGPGIKGANFDPSVTGAGNFILNYNTASIPSGLCPDHSTISIQVFSLPQPIITQVGPFCNKSQAVQLQVSPVGGLFESSIPGLISTAGLFNPAFARIGDNIISYSISSGPCIADAKLHISIEEFISADFSNVAQTIYCSNNYPFNLYGLVQHPGYAWGNMPAITGNMFDPSKAEIGVNTLTYQTYSSPHTLLCPDTKTFNIIVKDAPQVKASSNLYRGCAPLEVVLSSSAREDGGGVYSWNAGDGTTIKQTLSPAYIFASPGTYTVVFNYADNEALGCSTQVILNPIQVFETPKADFSISPEEITIADPEVNFTNLSTDIRNNRYTWTIQGLNELHDISPTVYFPQIGNYKVTLTATTIDNCKSTISKIVEIKNDFGVYIPNSFTPNYDGLNDVFKPVFSLYGLDTKNYSLEIYDRWGHQLFSTSDFTIGWNGTIQNKGEDPLKSDVYIFNLKYKDLDGRVYNKIGDVTLLK